MTCELNLRHDSQAHLGHHGHVAGRPRRLRGGRGLGGPARAGEAEELGDPVGVGEEALQRVPVAPGEADGLGLHGRDPGQLLDGRGGDHHGALGPGAGAPGERPGPRQALEEAAGWMIGLPMGEHGVLHQLKGKGGVRNRKSSP